MMSKYNFIKRSACGCNVSGAGTEENPWTVHHCPMHEAASDMLEALKELLGGTDADTDEAGMFIAECRWCGQDLDDEQDECRQEGCFGAKARAAIAKAEGGAR